MPPDYVAPPGEVHPAYADMLWLLDWINGRGPIKYDTVQIAVPLGAEMWHPGIPPISEREYRIDVMTRHRAVGPAPYVGDPFVYTWWVGIDHLGRQIASESTIRYTDQEGIRRAA